MDSPHPNGMGEPACRLRPLPVKDDGNTLAACDGPLPRPMAGEGGSRSRCALGLKISAHLHSRASEASSNSARNFSLSCIICFNRSFLSSSDIASFEKNLFILSMNPLRESTAIALS